MSVLQNKSLQNKSHVIQNLCELALKAGEVIMRHYQGEIKSALKDDQSPVTQADYEAERVILKGLARIAPNISAISEEEATLKHFPKTNERFFLVDPLDGTKEFIAGNGEFTVNIALIENHQPILGVIYAPAQERLFFAHQGQAFESRYGASAEPIRARCVPDEPILITSRSHKDLDMDELYKTYNASEVIRMGSSIKFCLIANGEADLYPRLGRTMAWDIAAGHAILKNAGGDLKSGETSLLYGEKPLTSLEACANPPFLAHGALTPDILED